MLLECEPLDESDAVVRKFVVKARGLPEVSDYELYVESVAYLIAAHLGVPTPRPAVIRIDPEFVDLVNPIIGVRGLMIERGEGFGSELVTAAIPVTGREALDPEQIEQARDIFCYDRIVQNPDRLIWNPNCLMTHGRLVAFDFNSAFSFLLSIGKTDEPWQFALHPNSGEHLFVSVLRRNPPDFRPFVDRLSSLSESNISDILDAVPYGDGSWNDRVREHLRSIVTNRGRLEVEFARCMT